MTYNVMRRIAERIRREASRYGADGTSTSDVVAEALESLAEIFEEEAEEPDLLVWGPGPMGFDATSDWRYWVPLKTDDSNGQLYRTGRYRAIFMPTGLPGQADQVLADDLATEAEAKSVCEKHAREND